MHLRSIRGGNGKTLVKSQSLKASLFWKKKKRLHYHDYFVIIHRDEKSNIKFNLKT